MSYPTKTYCLSPAVILWLEGLKARHGSVNKALIEMIPPRLLARLENQAKRQPKRGSKRNGNKDNKTN
jgi:hypothetical protein